MGNTEDKLLFYKGCVWSSVLSFVLWVLLAYIICLLWQHPVEGKMTKYKLPKTELHELGFRIVEGRVEIN